MYLNQLLTNAVFSSVCAGMCGTKRERVCRQRQFTSTLTDCIYQWKYGWIEGKKHLFHYFNAGGGQRRLQEKNLVQSSRMQWKTLIKGLFCLSSPGVTGMSSVCRFTFRAFLSLLHYSYFPIA